MSVTIYCISETSLRDVSGEEGRKKSFMFWDGAKLLNLLCPKLKTKGKDSGSAFWIFFNLFSYVWVEKAFPSVQTYFFLLEIGLEQIETIS